MNVILTQFEEQEKNIEKFDNKFLVIQGGADKLVDPRIGHILI